MAKAILKSIIDHNMIFLSAQPDTAYFHWQVEIYLHQFSQHGILNQCYALFGYTGKEPSVEAKRLQSMYPNVLFYKDERKNKLYTPGVRPHIYKKFFKDNPKLGKYVFIHDSDIFLIKLPNFKMMLEDKLKRSFVSDTISYIGFNYIKECCNRYKKANPTLPEFDLLDKMCKIVDIDPELVKRKQKESGGAQYFYRNMTYEFWDEAENVNNRLYKLMVDYEKKYKCEKHIQKWTSDMWVALWLYWKRGNVTIVHKELDFSWATGTINDYNKKNIFHLAGVTAKAKKVFYKGKYNNRSVLEVYNKDRGIFNHISDNSATKSYTQVIRDYFNNNYAKEKGYLTDEEYFKTDEGKKSQSLGRDAFGKLKTDGQSDKGAFFNSDKFKITGCKKFKIICDDSHYNFDGEYVIDNKTKHCNKAIWRSTNKKFIIYYNGNVWIATFARCENEMRKGGGGLSSNKCDEPYYNNWNQDCLIEIICD
jgi:hypothetical protein